MFPSHSAPTAAFPYVVEGKIGTGSMGIVYRATEVGLDRPVAIKVLRQSMLEDEPPEVQEEIRQRFMQEARAAAALSHPGATTVYRVGEDDGLPFIVMEWLEGRTLDTILEERSRFSMSEATGLGFSLLETLEVAHRAGVVHRDIKPANLVLLDDGRLKVTDFGIARLQGRELVQTQAGVVLATPQFAAPEQLRGLDVDGRTDLFATGILLYRLLTGHYPFEGKSFMELATAILRKDPPALREYVTSLPPQLDTIVRTALRKDRKDRFASAADMAEALHPFVQSLTPTTGSLRLPMEALDLEAEAETRGPQLRGAPDEPPLALVWVAAAWPKRLLDRQPTAALLDRLLEKPLHTAPFSGAAKLGDVWLFVCEGTLVGAVDAESGEQGDEVVDRLPVVAAPVLHPLPQTLAPQMVSLLSTLLHPPRLLHSDLDPSFINLPNLATRLRQDRFDGVLTLQRGRRHGAIFFRQGEEVLSMYSKDWDDTPVEQPWQQWLSQLAVRVSVAEKVAIPLGLWYRHSLPNFDLAVQPLEKGQKKDEESPNVNTTSSRIRQLLHISGRSSSLATGQMVLRLSPQQAAMGVDVSHYQQAPSFQFLSWALNELPEFLVERKKLGAWKYLGEWLPLVRQVKLHHDLPRPGSRGADYFDLVTFDGEEKVLHVGQHIDHPTVDQFLDFIEHVLLAKTARTKSGDIGGAFLIASKLDEEVLASYSERIKGVTGIFGLEDSITGYNGFIRIGTRRGFHLMLVQYDGTGYEPLLPS